VKDDQLKPHKDAERQKFAPVQLQLFAHKVKVMFSHRFREKTWR